MRDARKLRASRCGPSELYRKETRALWLKRRPWKGRIMLNDAVKGFLYRILRTPSREAVFDRATGKRYAYFELGCRGARLAKYLTDDLGLQQGEVIALSAENNIAFIDAFYASLMTGVIITTYNGRLRADDLAPLIARERPRVVFVSEGHRQKIEESCRLADASCVLVSLDGEDGSLPCYSDIMAGEIGACSLPSLDGFADFDIEETQLLVHTGGTTGLPKSAKISFRAVLYNALSEILTVGLTQRDCGITFLPFFHTVGWNVTTLPSLLVGARIVLTDSLDPGVLLELIASERPTTGLALEAVFRRMAEHPAFASTDFSSYRLLANGAGPISTSTMELYWRRGVKLINAYGMTETGPNNCFYPDSDESLESIMQHSDTVGKPMCFTELKIVDEEGREVPTGTDGELLWRGPVTFSGYWNDRASTAGIMAEGGWVRSGDIGHLDRMGYVHLQGRLKNMIVTNGENVFPIEIENTMKDCPGVEECCVIGVPDAERGEVAKALVHMEEGAAFDRDALERFVRGKLSSIKVPHYFVEVDDFFKRGLKVDLGAIKERYGHAGE